MVYYILLYKFSIFLSITLVNLNPFFRNPESQNPKKSQNPESQYPEGQNLEKAKITKVKISKVKTLKVKILKEPKSQKLNPETQNFVIQNPEWIIISKTLNF